jgi:fatty acid synthase subunit alpha
VATEIPRPNPALAAPSPVAVAVEDSPLSAGDIVVALTAQKLKKPFDHVPIEKSIRELSGGESK